MVVQDVYLEIRQMVFAELMVQLPWLWLLLKCVLMAGLYWVP